MHDDATSVRRIAVVAKLLLAAACGSGAADDDATSSGQSTSGGAISAGLTGFVVAGDEAGWVVDRFLIHDRAARVASAKAVGPGHPRATWPGQAEVPGAVPPRHRSS
jgi:hypothetical protein